MLKNAFQDLVSVRLVLGDGICFREGFENLLVLLAELFKFLHELTALTDRNFDLFLVLGILLLAASKVAYHRAQRSRDSAAYSRCSAASGCGRA